MAPNVEEAASPKYFDDDDVVISGISGHFPNCDSFEDFKEKLFNGTDILAEADDKRWPDGEFCQIIIKPYAEAYQ